MHRCPCCIKFHSGTIFRMERTLLKAANITKNVDIFRICFTVWLCTGISPGLLLRRVPVQGTRNETLKTFPNKHPVHDMFVKNCITSLDVSSSSVSMWQKHSGVCGQKELPVPVIRDMVMRTKAWGGCQVYPLAASAEGGSASRHLQWE